LPSRESLPIRVSRNGFERSPDSLEARGAKPGGRVGKDIQTEEYAMKARTLSRVVVTFALTLMLFATGFEGAKAESPASPADRLVVVPAADVKWTDLDPTGAPGVKIADLWGDHTKGAFGAFLKLPAGFAVPLHTHTHDIKVVIVSGTYIQVPDGKPEFRIGPGSYFLQPGGDYRHTTACDKASECVFYAESAGSFDLKVVDAGKAPARK
jgi:uncharacterized protein DUF4437